MQFDSAIAKAAPTTGADTVHVNSRMARFLAPALQLEESGPPSIARWTIGLAALSVASFVGWASWMPLKEVSVGRGEVMPLGFAQQVQHLEGGIVSRVLAVEGRPIKAGDPIVELDDTAVRADLAQTQERHVSLILSISRLKAFAEDRSTDLTSVGREFQSIVDTQQAVFAAQTDARRAQLLGALGDVLGRQESFRAAEMKLGKLEEEFAIVEKALDRRMPLLQAGLVRLPEVEALQRDKLRLETEIARTRSDMTGARISIDQGEAKREEIVARLRQEALQDVIRAQGELADVLSTIEKQRDKLARLAVRSPVDGVVKEMAVKGPGAVLAPGAPIAEIVPSDRNVFAEVEVSPDDIGHIRPGLPAVVKVSTYDHTRFGGVNGTVDTVSPSSFHRPNMPSVFRVRVKLDSMNVGPGDAHMDVRPGMAVTADIRTGEKTLMEYLLKPLRAAVTTVFSER